MTRIIGLDHGARRIGVAGGDTETRMACLFVELVEDKGEGLMTFVVTPIPTDDSRVTGHRVTFVAEPSGPGPTPRCAACV